MTSKRVLGGALAVAVAPFVAMAVYRAYRPTSIDDAYMVLRYAKQILAGHGHAWNPDGQQVFGATGTLHLALVTVFEAVLPLGDAGVVALASVAFGVLALGSLAWIAQSLVREPLRAWPWLVVGGVWLLVIPQRLFISQALSGMDAMSAVFANCWVAGTALWLARTGTNRAVAASVGAALLAILARPDDGLYAVLTPALAVLLAGPHPRLPLLAKLAGGMTAMLALYLAAATAVFGDPLPLPFYAKSIGYFNEYSAAREWNPFEYLGEILAAWLPALLVILFGVRRRTAGEVTALLAPVALTFAYYFTVLQIMGNGARYYVPATPFPVLAALVVVDDWCAATSSARELGRALARRWPLALLLALTSPAVLDYAEVAYGNRAALEDNTFPPACYERSAEGRLPPADYEAIIRELAALAETLPPGARIALSEHGRIGAAAPHVFLDDLIALHDPEFAHRGFDPAVEIAREPDAIWFPHSAYVALWHDLAAFPGLWAEYDVWPDALSYGFAIRRESPHRAQIQAGWQGIWGRLYPGADASTWRAVRLRSELPECRRESRIGAAPRNAAGASEYNRVPEGGR